MTTFDLQEIRLIQADELKRLKDKVRQLEVEIESLRGRLVFKAVSDWSVVNLPDALL